jgi:RimJ/RimL family protein N-acetyltransferase
MNYKILKKLFYRENKYVLVSFRRDDLYLVKNWRNEQIAILRQDHLLTDDEQASYYQNVIEPSFFQSFPKLMLFSFLYDEICIGYGGLTNIDWNSRRAEISFLVDTNRQKDLTQYENDFSTFLLLIKKISFCDLNLNRLITETFNIRERHVNILEKSGFRIEGVMREHIFINGEKVDSLLHGFLKADYDV